jgi:cytoskeletal protein CcmA (bactofilin family)
MAIFGKNRPQQGPGHGATIIAAGTQLVGNLTLSDRLHVDGRLDGDVASESAIVVGTEGFIEGTVKAKTVVVSGRVKGSISADRLEIIAGGRVEGDVHIVELVIEPGGRFNGSSEILAAEQPRPRKAAARAGESEGRAKPDGAQPGPESSTAPS